MLSGLQNGFREQGIPGGTGTGGTGGTGSMTMCAAADLTMPPSATNCGTSGLPQLSTCQKTSLARRVEQPPVQLVVSSTLFSKTLRKGKAARLITPPSSSV